MEKPKGDLKKRHKKVTPIIIYNNVGIPLTGLTPICSIGEYGGLSENLERA